MSSIHNYYITSQLFQLVEERVASIEVEKKTRPIAAMFVRLFDEIDFNISNELVAEALEKLIFFIHKDGVTSTVEFAQIEKFFTDDEDQLFVEVKGQTFQVVEPAQVDDNDGFDDFEDEEEGVEYEENNEISLDDDDSYIVVDGNEIVEEYELNDDITLDDDESYLVIEDDLDDSDLDETEDLNNLSFVARPIILDNAHAELITLAATTDLDELLEEQLDDMPAFKEIFEQLEVIRKEVKKEAKKDKKSKKDKKKNKKKKKSKHKKDKDSKKDKSKKDLTAKIAKKLHQYVLDKELEQELLVEFVELKKQIDYIVIQY